jgi:Ni/Co efflux regulator RcnB
VTPYHRIIRNESVEGSFIELDKTQAHIVDDYISRYHAGLGYPPAGLHWIPELGDFVFVRAIG